MMTDRTETSEIVLSLDHIPEVNEPMPVILVLYDVAEDRAYWLHVQEYFRGREWAARTRGATTVSVHVPASHVLDEAAIRRFAQLRDRCLVNRGRRNRS